MKETGRPVSFGGQDGDRLDGDVDLAAETAADRAADHVQLAGRASAG